MPFISKLVECCMLYRFNEHCDQHGLLQIYQSAYRRFHSCETALVKMTNDLLWAMEHKNSTALMGIDLSVAFDTGDHTILIEVMNINFGVNGTALKWSKSYLRPRWLKVKVGKEYSNPINLEVSAPQGSCEGSVLYCTMQKDLPPDTAMNIYGYAGDHNLGNKFKPSVPNAEKETISIPERSLYNIKNWIDKKCLKMNDGKTEFMTLGLKHQLEKCETESININGIHIRPSPCIKFLGAWTDQQLSLKKHISVKCCTAMFNLQRLKPIHYKLDENAAHTLVLGLVISHLDYANGILSGLPDIDINKLQIVQDVAAKFVCDKDKYSSASEYMAHLHWLPIRQRIDYKVLTIVYCCLNNEAPEYLKDLLAPLLGHREGLRSAEQYQRLLVPYVRCKTVVERSFNIRAPKLWNTLPNYIKQSSNTDIFKKKLKTYLCRKSYTLTLLLII